MEKKKKNKTPTFTILAHLGSGHIQIYPVHAHVKYLQAPFKLQSVSPFNFIWFSRSSVDTEVKAISWERGMHSRAGCKILVLSLHWSQVEWVGRVLWCFRDVALREHDITRIVGVWSR